MAHRLDTETVGLTEAKSLDIKGVELTPVDENPGQAAISSARSIRGERPSELEMEG